MTEIKKKGRPSKQDNILTKNAFEKKEDPLPIEEKKVEVPAASSAAKGCSQERDLPKEVPPTAPNTPVVPLLIDMPKPKKERSTAQIEATKKMLEANKLKKVTKEIIIKEEAKPEAKENLKVALKKAKPAPVVKDRSPTPVPVKKEKKVKKPVKYETSSEEESESSSEEYIQKFEKKAARKIQVVNSIEERLRQNAIPRNKYSNLSIFS